MFFFSLNFVKVCMYDYAVFILGLLIFIQMGILDLTPFFCQIQVNGPWPQSNSLAQFL